MLVVAVARGAAGRWRLALPRAGKHCGYGRCDLPIGPSLGSCLLAGGGVQERSQAMAAARVTQFAKRLGLNLPNALARDGEMLTDFFECVFAAILQSEAHLDDLFFARAERFQNFRCLLAEIQVNDGFTGRRNAAIHDEI